MMNALDLVALGIGRERPENRYCFRSCNREVQRLYGVAHALRGINSIPKPDNLSPIAVFRTTEVKTPHDADLIT